MSGKVPEDLKSFNVRGGDTLRARPELTALAGSVLGMWPTVELTIAQMISLLAGDAAALETLDSLRAKNARNDEMRRLAATHISSPELQDAFDQVTAFVVRAAWPRNKLAHWVWGTHEALPDSLLLSDPDVTLQFSRQLMFGSPDRTHASEGPGKTTSTREGKLDPAEAMKLINLFRDSTEVWRASDFIKAKTGLNQSIMLMVPLCNAFAAGEGTKTASDATKQAHQMLRRFNQ